MSSSTARRLTLRKRSDLAVIQQRYAGRDYWVVKDPLGLNYFRFQPEEYAIFELLDGRTSVDQIKLAFEARFAPQKIALSQLSEFIGQLHRSGLVISDTPGQGAELRASHQRQRQQWLGKLANPLAIRFRGLDPQWLLDRSYPWVRWFFSLPAVIASVLLGIAALSLLLVQFDTFTARLPSFSQFFTWSNAWCLIAVLAVTKVLHEFGHALTCKHFGGECHEMGLMFLVFTPALYCNVSDAWLWPSKWRRMAVGAGGMYVELVLASLATFCWWFTQPGLLHNLCLSTMFVCSVSTLLFNGNPLLRYDGYYILSDLVEVPNLSQKGSAMLQRFCSWLCLGMEMPEDPFMPRRRQWLLACYAAASVAYRWLVVLSILFFINAFFKSHRVPVLGQAFGLFTLMGLVVWPLWRVGRFFYVPGRTELVKRHRMALSLAALSLVLAGILFLPLPDRVWATLELQPRNAESVYVEVPGQLVEVLVRPGDTVAKDQVLGRLQNIDVQLDVAELQGRRDKLAIELRSLRQQQFHEPTAGLQIAEVQESLSAIEEQLRQRETDLARLALKSPVVGTVIAPPEHPKPPAPEGELASWSGSPFDRRNREALLEASTVFCQIGNPRQLEALLVVDQSDVELVREGQSVEICFDSLPDQRWQGTIREISKVDLKVSPRHLSNKTGGELATKTDAGGIERPLSTSYQVLVPLDDLDARLLPGLRGQAKIATPWQPLASRLWRWATRTFYFRL